jgi:transposase-like protein
MSRIEVLSGPERRRRWSAEQKQSIVAEAFAPGASVCEVARRVDLVPSLIYRWRQELRSAAAGFSEVVVAPEPSERTVAAPAALVIELSVSTMADHVGACAATLTPLYELIKAHVFAAERIHGDDTTVPVLAKVKTRTGRIWTYVRDDRPFGLIWRRRIRSHHQSRR